MCSYLFTSDILTQKQVVIFILLQFKSHVTCLGPLEKLYSKFKPGLLSESR